MRTAATLFLSENTSAGATHTVEATLSPPAAIPRSPWHSPVPYLFGGLAAMLGLIAFALLILACSYWKLSGQENSEDQSDVEGAAAVKGESGSEQKASHVMEEKYLVIMAGHAKPTFLATPVSSRASSFNDNPEFSDHKHTRLTSPATVEEDSDRQIHS